MQARLNGAPRTRRRTDWRTLVVRLGARVLSLFMSGWALMLLLGVARHELHASVPVPGLGVCLVLVGLFHLVIAAFRRWSEVPRKNTLHGS